MLKPESTESGAFSLFSMSYGLLLALSFELSANSPLSFRMPYALFLSPFFYELRASLTTPLSQTLETGGIAPLTLHPDIGACISLFGRQHHGYKAGVRILQKQFS